MQETCIVIFELDKFSRMTERMSMYVESLLADLGAISELP